MIDQQISLGGIMERLRDLRDKLEAGGWTVTIRLVCSAPDPVGRVTFELGQDDDVPHAQQ